jgi:modification methylase
MRDIEEILVLRKPKLPGQKLSPERKARWEQSALTKDEWRECFAQVWTFPGARKETAGGVVHPAPFPVELPLRCIKMYSVKGDTVLDPFLGTGTTTLVAMRTDRKSIGFEVEERFVPHILSKTHILENSLEAVM